MLFASSEDESWEKLWEYVESHRPDADAYPVVRPNTAAVREALREAGARILHEFHSFNGMAIGMKVGDLPNKLKGPFSR